MRFAIVVQWYDGTTTHTGATDAPTAGQIVKDIAATGGFMRVIVTNLDNGDEMRLTSGQTESAFKWFA